MTHDNTTASSTTSSCTHVHVKENNTTKPPGKSLELPPDYGESGLQGDKLKVASEKLDDDDDWENDPENARNWPWAKKWGAVSVVSLYTFVSPLASSMMAPGLPEVGIKYGITNPTVIALTLSIFLLAFALGPLVLAPLSEMYGRTWVLHIANIFTVIFSLGCAFTPNTGSLVAMRFLSGLSASAPLAIGSGSVSDLFSERDRASAMATFSLGPLVGPVVGPIAGGFIAQELGIRYVFIVIAAICGVASLVGLPFLRETYAPVIRMKRAARSGDPEAAAKFNPIFQQAHGSKARILWIYLSRPVMLLCKSFICFILSLYQAFIYGVFYLMFATFADFFAKTYGFGPGVGGLAYLGLGVGFFIATYIGARIGDQIYYYLASKNGGVGKPEMRIPVLFFGSFFIPIGVFWYGWSAQAKAHWIMPIIGSGIFGFGMMTIFLPIQLYLVDTFTYAASATAAAALFRSLLGFSFPLFGTQMFNALGMGPGNSLLAGLAIVLGIPFPVWIYLKGEEIRARNPLTRSAGTKVAIITPTPRIEESTDKEKQSV